MDENHLFICECCGGVFEKGSTDEEALAEAKKTFGDIPEEQQATICDNCYKDFMKWYNKEKVKRGH